MAFKTIVTSEDYPNIIEALNTIEADNGQSIAMPVREVPLRWKDFLPQIEQTLAGLSRKDRAPESAPLAPHIRPSEFLDSEFYTFCSGEYSEMQAMQNRDINHARAGVFLYDFFEDWSYTDDGANKPANKSAQNRIEWLESVAQESSLGLSPEQKQEVEQLYLTMA